MYNSQLNCQKKRIDKNMVVKKKKKEIGSIEIFYLFFVFLLAARATTFTNNLDPRVNPLGFILAYGLPTYIYYKHRIRLNRNIKWIFFIISLWAVAQYITNQPFKILTYVLFFLNIFSAYVLVQLYKKKLFFYTEKIIYCFSCIAIVLWCFMHIIGTTYMANFGLFTPTSSTSAASFLIYNVPSIEVYEGTGILGFQRNCGFCWEPGLFSSFINVALFNNLVRTKNNILKNNKEFWLLFLALLTTMSTTGYTAFIAIIFMHFIIGKMHKLFKFKNLIPFIIFIYITYEICQLPFMAEKIQDKLNPDDFITERIYALDFLDENNEVLTVDRFEGLYLDFLNFIDKPLFGFGLSRETSFVNNNISKFLMISNGSMSLFASFGLILGLIISYFLIYNSRKQRDIFKYNDKSFFILYIILSFSYCFNYLTLFMAICFYYTLSIDPIKNKKRLNTKKCKHKNIYNNQHNEI